MLTRIFGWLAYEFKKIINRPTDDEYEHHVFLLAKEIGMKLLEQELRTRIFPDEIGTEKYFFGIVDYTVSRYLPICAMYILSYL